MKQKEDQSLKLERAINRRDVPSTQQLLSCKAACALQLGIP
jgi:hypothetical protein